jgi:hypothetical protein
LTEVGLRCRTKQEHAGENIGTKSRHKQGLAASVESLHHQQNKARNEMIGIGQGFRENCGQATFAAVDPPAGGPSTSSHPDDASVRDEHLAVLLRARGHLVSRCRLAAERLGEGWKPWSVNDIDVLIHIGDAIAVLDKLVRESVERDEPTRPAGRPVD